MSIDEPLLRRLTNVFLEENKKLNLSAFRTEEHCWVGNVLDSLGLLQAFEHMPELRDIRRALDMGTGGGFPLLALALCLPETAFYGIDSTQKKMDAVQRILDAMQMKNVTLHAGRLEEFGHQEGLRATFDLVTARALAPLPALLEYGAPFLRVGGILACYKSTKLAVELASSATAQRLLSCPFLRTFEYELPAEWGRRTIVFFKKTAPTAPDYPRRVGVPTSTPLT